MGILENAWRECVEDMDPPLDPSPIDSQVKMNISEVIAPLLGIGSYNAMKLLFLLAENTDSNGQVNKSRKELSENIGMNDNKGNFSNLLKKLDEMEFIARFGSTIVVNPFVFYHHSLTRKQRTILELSWDILVTYNDNDQH